MSKQYVWVNVHVYMVRVEANQEKLPTSLNVSVKGRDGRLHRTHTLDITWKEWEKDGDYMTYTFTRPPTLTIISVIGTPSQCSPNFIPRFPIPIHIEFRLKRGLHTFCKYRVEVMESGPFESDPNHDMVYYKVSFSSEIATPGQRPRHPRDYYYDPRGFGPQYYNHDPAMDRKASLLLCCPCLTLLWLCCFRACFLCMHALVLL